MTGSDAEQAIRHKTGLPPATYFSGPKLQWLLENIDGLRAAAEAGDALSGTVDTWSLFGDDLVGPWVKSGHRRIGPAVRRSR